MSETQKLTGRRELEKAIIKKAREDEGFRQALVDNPKEVLGQLGVQVPAEMEIKVVEESAKVVYLVLPVHPDELTDQQLDAVAGGFADLCGDFSPVCTLLDDLDKKEYICSFSMMF